MVEDTFSKAEMVLEECAALGLQVTHVGTLYEAIKALRAPDHGFCAVVTDWVFPARLDSQWPEDNMGQRVFWEAEEQELPVVVFSSREKIPEGVSPWIKGDRPELLTEWLKKIA